MCFKSRNSIFRGLVLLSNRLSRQSQFSAHFLHFDEISKGFKFAQLQKTFIEILHFQQTASGICNILKKTRPNFWFTIHPSIKPCFAHRSAHSIWISYLYLFAQLLQWALWERRRRNSLLFSNPANTLIFYFTVSLHVISSFFEILRLFFFSFPSILLGLRLIAVQNRSKNREGEQIFAKMYLIIPPKFWLISFLLLRISISTFLKTNLLNGTLFIIFQMATLFARSVSH